MLTDDKANYRNLNSYKYQLLNHYQVSIKLKPSQPIETKFVQLDSSGVLTIRSGYAWDGATGAPDTRKILRGSLVHDALYQLMRLSLLDSKTDRQTADIVMIEICLADGMSKFYALIVYQVLRWFAAGAAKPRDEKPDPVYTIP